MLFRAEVSARHPRRVMRRGVAAVTMGPVSAAVGWGALAASSLVLGVVLALVRPWPPRAIGLVLSFGAGALTSAVSFELAEEGIALAGAGWVGVGLAAGALAYFLLDRPIERSPSASGGALALGATLDGIPEGMVLGIGIAAGEGVSVALLMAIFVSNLPEGLGSASDMLAAGRPRRRILRLWSAVAVVCAAACVAGYALADVTGDRFAGVVDGFAAGALLVMLAGAMFPEAREKAGLGGGLVVALGFAVAAGLSSLSG
jgi:zinc transporter, ZIP family